MANKSNMADRITESLSKLIQDELDSRCPEEAMNRHLPDLDGTIVASRIEDGNLVLDVQRPSGIFCLTLKPVEWRKK